MQVPNFVETKISIAFVMKDENKLITAGPFLFETFRCWKLAWKFHGKVEIYNLSEQREEVEIS